MDLTVMKTESVPLWGCHSSGAVIHFEKCFQGATSVLWTRHWNGSYHSSVVTFLVGPDSFAACAYLCFWTESLCRWAPRRQCWCQSLWFLTKTPELPIPSGSHCQSLQIKQNPLLLLSWCFDTQLYFPLENLPFLLASQHTSCSPAATTGPPVRSTLLCLAFNLSLTRSPALVCHASCSVHPAAASPSPPTLLYPLLHCHDHLRMVACLCHAHLFSPSCPPSKT